MKPFRKIVIALLLLVMLFSLLSLSGCKKKTGDEQGNSDPSQLGTTDDGHDHDGVLTLEDEDLDVRVFPAGVATLPVESSTNIRGAIASGSFDYTLDSTGGDVIIPIGTVPAGTVITVPIHFDGVTFSILIYDQDGGADSYEYFAAFGVSANHGLVDGCGYYQIEHQGYTSYLVCKTCGQILRQDVMGVESNAISRDFCFPWTINHEDCMTFQLNTQTIEAFPMYGWISDTETGEYSPGVPYITKTQAAGTKAVLIPFSTIRSAFETFYTWSAFDDFMNGVGLPEGMEPAADVSGTSDDGIASIPTVTD